MVLPHGVVRFFQPASDETPNENEWHAFHESEAEAVCGQARISYNRDVIADAVPSNGRFHLACREALSAEENPPETETTENEDSQTISSSDVASLSSVLGEPDAQPPADAGVTDGGSDNPEATDPGVDDQTQPADQTGG